jgi:hypothetical protein
MTVESKTNATHLNKKSVSDSNTRNGRKSRKAKFIKTSKNEIPERISVEKFKQSQFTNCNFFAESDS